MGLHDTTKCVWFLLTHAFKSEVCLKQHSLKKFFLGILGKLYDDGDMFFSMFTRENGSFNCLSTAQCTEKHCAWEIV